MVSTQITEFWEQIPALPARVTDEELPAAKAGLIGFCLEQWPILPGAVTDRVTLDGVDAVWHLPSNADSRRVVLYVHGGGYVWCSADAQAGLISRIAVATGCKTLALDYKVAPGSPFPGPVNEGVTLFKWLLESGHDPADIAIVGDSAGGGLALAIIHALAVEGVEPPGCVAVSSAWTDLTNSGESIDWVTLDKCVDREGLDFCVELYLQGHDATDPLASPLFADLSVFPPMLVQVGSRERLLSDSTRLAAKADGAGVDVQLEVYDGCNHLWQWWVPESPEAISAVASIAEFVRKHTA